MADGKRYYWLKLYDDFFGSLRIKKLRRMAGGDTYVIIYLKLQLKAMKTDGILKWKGYEQDFVDELSLDIDEEPDDVRVTLMYLLSCGLAETDDNVSFFFPYAVENTGSETSSTQRWRDWKNRKMLESNTTPTQLQQNANVEIETRDRDRDRDKLLSDFDAFWSAYPKKVGKQAAIKSYEKALKLTDADTILKAIERQKKSEQWTRDNGRYIPNPTTWLNQGRWDDVTERDAGQDNETRWRLRADIG